MENNHGTKIFEKGIRQGRARDEGTQVWDFEERPVRQDGQEPQAGDRDRPFGSESCGGEGPEEDRKAMTNRQEAEGEEVAPRISFSSWPGLTRPSMSFFLLCRKDVDARA
jgi:hypothetical protein